MAVETRIGTHLVVPAEQLPLDVRTALQAALMIANPWKPTAVREKLYGAEQMPDEIPLYDYENGFFQIPRGFIHNFIAGCHAIGIEIAWVDERVAIERTCCELTPITLDSYQEIACQAFIAHNGGLVSAPTGSGKTAIMLETIRRLNQRTIIIVEKASLGAQWISQIREKLGYEPGYLGEGQWVERDITVALRQTLWSKRDDPDSGTDLAQSFFGGLSFWKRWGAVMLDECFVAGTMVGDRPIETIGKGDVVPSYDGDLVGGRVGAVWKHRPTRLVRVWLKGRDPIVCTPNHPLLTPAGWLPAGSLCGSMMLSSKNEQTNRGAVRMVRVAGCVDNQAQDRFLEKNRANVLLRRASGFVGKSRFFQTNVDDKSKVRIRENDAQQSYETSRCQKQGFSVSQESRPSTSEPRWKRKMFVRAAKKAFASIGLGDGDLYRSIQKNTRKGSFLHDRHGVARSYGCRRGRWAKPFFSKCSRTRREEGSIFEWARVDSVEVLKSGSDGRFGGLCPDGYVYNFEVEETHTYIAGGVVVHNCHHAPAETLVDLLQRFYAYFRGGGSATPERDPLLFPIAQVVIGPVVHETSFEEAKARLVRPTIRVVETEFDFPNYHPTERKEVWDDAKGRTVVRTIRNNYGEMMAALIADESRNRLICDRIALEANAGHQCLVVSARKEHLIILHDLLAGYELSVSLYTLFGGANGEEARELACTIEKLPSGQGSILFSTVADEGLDIPRLDRDFLVFPSRKIGSTKQKIGRVTRRHEMKDDAIVYDFRDKHMRLLNDQFRDRRQLLYNKEGFMVEMEERVPT
jgi:superfamily II DNA or RNA helicase